MSDLTNSSTQPLFRVDHLSWSCGKKRILDDISFEFDEGSFVGLIGPNGSGKSSLMRCCYRVNKPSSGHIFLEGKDIWHQRLKDNAKQIAVILQEHHDHLGLSVKEVVLQGLAPHKSFFEWDTLDDHQFISQVLSDLDLRHIQSSLFSHLSGGEKQRVMLARAIVQRPKLLIMDEPTNHLDVHYQIDLLSKVKQLGVTVLSSFHDLNLASAFCDRLLVLNRGCLVANDNCEAVLTESLISEVFNARVIVDRHPSTDVPRVSYVY
jgi:iron complex transport system ATP-binding protein